MAKVKVGTRYALSDEALKLCNKGKTWWCRNRTKGEFVKIPYTPANQTFDIELDLEDGEYQCGCGDYNTVDSNGRHCSQTIYFYVAGGKLTYVKRASEFPSVTGTSAFNPFDTTPADDSTKGETAPATFNPFGGSDLTTPSQAVQTEKYSKVDGVMYCVCNSKVVTPEYTCVVDYIPSNDAVSGLDCCETCNHSRVVYIKEE